ncbi:MAG TPA: hypothetical protein VFO66_08430 [Gemmatimonadaceae bacterium]|nr:hypothetical protein [Gemmatimonadaceae bacterium]
MTRFYEVVTTAGLILLGACGSRDGARDSAGGDAGQDLNAAPVTAGIGIGSATSMRVTLTGGPKPGTYEKSSDEPTCTVGWASEGAWGNAASDLEDKSGLIGIDLIVPKPEAAKGGTSEFMLTVYLDDRLDPANQFTVDPPNGKGTGTVTIEDRGSTATVTARGKTPEGVEVDARIECRQILRAE